jgi:ATP-dependent helicase/nuclease subunit A
VKPLNILCLTYTKAAASEMQNRLFKRLGEWSMLSDNDLRKSLAELGVAGAAQMEVEKLRDARTLFAQAIETPGGLKIQTIHSFCAALLRRFPLEAGVSPQFTEIEDRAAELLRLEIVDQMAESTDATVIADLAFHYTGEDFSALTREVVDKRDKFSGTLILEDALTLMGQPRDLTDEKVLAQVFLGGEVAMIQALLPYLEAGGVRDQEAAAKLARFQNAELPAVTILESVFLTGSGAKAPFSAKVGSFPGKPIQKAQADKMPALEALMLRVEAARDARLALAAAKKTVALHAFAQRFIPRYESEKENRGWLDFDDLIVKARALLQTSEMAAWVLFRIDGGIDHILVDEAQDTSPQQWDVIERLTDEFFSGKGVREAGERTLFVVGDKKQSIYSFQGADPREFDRKRDMFEAKITGAQQLFQRRNLEYSFRSAGAVLRSVDTTFSPNTRPEFDKDSQHIAFKADLPGRVDIWPHIEPVDDKEDRNWSDPVDRRSAQHHTVILADQIAAQIKKLTEGAHFIPDEHPDTKAMVKRRIRAGDFLILVQRRSPLFAEIIRACKAADLPIAGADRLKVGAELAVRDLRALLSFLATPDDDLALATALKSPLFGWSEQDLYSLAQGREKKILWQVLRGGETLYPVSLAMINDLRNQVDFLRPFDLIERILTRHEGRRKFLSRLGKEAEDGINAILSQALAYEQNDVPSITGFLEWMQGDDLDIKRQIDSASNQIRVMTVHGAKGLEAPIVILPDTGERKLTVRDDIVELKGAPIWKPKSDQMPHALQDVIDTRKEAEFEERLRLLYVAMTRAEKWLIVAAAGRLQKDEKTWFQIVKAAMKHTNAVEVTNGISRYEEGDWDGLPVFAQREKTIHPAALDPIFTTSVGHPLAPTSTLSPSNLGGAKALGGEEGQDEEAALSFGSLVHRFLELFPDLSAAQQTALAPRIGASSTDEDIQTALVEVQGVLASADFGYLFAKGTLAEVPISAEVHGKRYHGNIDRLIVTDTHVLAVDYKTNRNIPTSPTACPEGLLRQMGAYGAMLKTIYPNHQIDTAFLWTYAPSLMVLPHDIVREAFARAP